MVAPGFRTVMGLSLPKGTIWAATVNHWLHCLAGKWLLHERGSIDGIGG